MLKGISHPDAAVSGADAGSRELGRWRPKTRRGIRRQVRLPVPDDLRHAGPPVRGYGQEMPNHAAGAQPDCFPNEKPEHRS